jgi:2-polyprenyl-3-methyl-5-hydroxy-6-metoxy-1,4-benzoquinol methylase
LTHAKDIFEKEYEKPDARWTNENPPQELIELIDSETIKPCKTLDIGCGEGFYSIYLAERGFKVAGIDFSEKAIEYAKKNAQEKDVNVKFIAMNVKDLDKLNEKFEFVFEWAFLHCITKPKERKEYIENVSKLLNNGGKYFSICFNEDQLKEIPKESKKKLESILYFSSLNELKELFNPYFKIIESKVLEIAVCGKKFIWNYFLMEKE